MGQLLHGRQLGFLLVIGLFSLGNSSNAFLILKAEHVGVSPVWISGPYLVFNGTYASLSVPAGMLADRFGMKQMILCGFVLFAMVYAGFALATSAWQIAGLFIGYGIYMGVADGVLRAYLATLIREEQKATGFGLYHMVVGLAILPASLIAGFLWDTKGPAAPFTFGAVMATLSALAFAWLAGKNSPTRV